MSFIVITYGYNLYSIFNIESTTLPLIDNIIKSVFSNIRSTLSQKKEVFQGELQVLTNEEESLKKQITKLEQDKVKEEEKQEEIRRQKEIEAKKDLKGKSKPLAKQGNTVKGNTVQLLIDEIQKLIKSSQVVSENKEKYNKKLKQVNSTISTYDSIDETKIKFDLVDLAKGVRVEIDKKDNIEAKEYLEDKECYEMVIEKVNDKGETIYETLKVDGFVLRTNQEDIIYDEMEKSGRFNKNKGKKK